MPPEQTRPRRRNWRSYLPTREFKSALSSDPIASRLPLFLPTGRGLPRRSRSSSTMPKGYLVSWQSSTSYLSLLPFANLPLVETMLSFPKSILCSFISLLIQLEAVVVHTHLPPFH